MTRANIRTAIRRWWQNDIRLRTAIHFAITGKYYSRYYHL